MDDLTVPELARGTHDRTRVIGNNAVPQMQLALRADCGKLPLGCVDCVRRLCDCLLYALERQYNLLLQTLACAQYPLHESVQTMPGAVEASALRGQSALHRK